MTRAMDPDRPPHSSKGPAEPPMTADQPPRSDSPEDRVVILYGALRSGTTMIRLMLDAHPQISCPGEMDFMVDFLRPGASDRSPDQGPDQGPNLRLDRDELAADRIFRASGLSVPETDDGAAAFWDMARQAGADRQGHVLIPVMHRHLGDLLRVFPKARIIHLVRDPRDVARSSIGMGWAGNTWFGVDHWIGTEQEWDRHGAALPPDQVFSLRYETLLTAPEQELGRLCAFIGLDYDPAMLTFDQTSSYAAVDPALAFQWKRKQTPREVADVEHKVGPLLAARGYARSGHPPGRPGLLRRLALLAGNKRHIWKVRFARYGYRDPVQETLSRRLGLTSLRRAAQRRIDRKLERYLK